MARKGDFSNDVKEKAIKRQGGVCAFCGVPLKTPWTPQGAYPGNAHHLQPDLHDGEALLDNCVYLCRVHHLLFHGMAPEGIDKQGGSSRTWVRLSRSAFPFWFKGGPSRRG
jgi:hypothetical protein